MAGWPNQRGKSPTPDPFPLRWRGEMVTGWHVRHVAAPASDELGN